MVFLNCNTMVEQYSFKYSNMVIDILDKYKYWDASFNPAMPGLRSRALCGAVCALPIAIVFY